MDGGNPYPKQTTPTNCLAACMAGLTGIPLEEFPACFDGLNYDWDAIQDWLGDRGWQAIDILYQLGILFPVRRPLRCILSFPSPRIVGFWHAVVGEWRPNHEGFEVKFDPYWEPSDFDELKSIMLLVRIDQTNTEH